MDVLKVSIKEELNLYLFNLYIQLKKNLLIVNILIIHLLKKLNLFLFLIYFMFP